MVSQRNHLIRVLALWLASVFSTPIPTWAAANVTPDIVLPDPFALELPDGVSSLGIADEPMKKLIATVRAEGHPVTAVLPRSRVGTGGWRVILTAWDSEAHGRPIARREAVLAILPHGMTPIGTSGYSNATGGNNAAHIARDSSGFMHMVWSDDWRPGAHPGAQYRRGRILADGTAQLETSVQDLGPEPGNWTALPSLVVAGDTIHFAWRAGGTARYRSLIHEGANWRWTDEVDTKAPAPLRDVGVVIAADAHAVHILTPGGVYTASHDGGQHWITETVPFGTDGHVKTQSLTLGLDGEPVAAASVVVVTPPVPLSEDRGHGAFWALRMFRRSGPGTWRAIPTPVDGRPEWGRPLDTDSDVYCDWVRLMADPAGGMHLTWHGSSISRIYGNDRAYYAWASPDGSWHAPVSLREPDAAHGFGWSYAPGLILDGDTAMPLVFYDIRAGWRDRGFDSDLNLFRDGRRLADPLPVTRFASSSLRHGEPAEALSAWFPGAAPALFRAADGRIWADVLVALIPSGAPGVIVWRRLDVTAWMASARQ